MKFFVLLSTVCLLGGAHAGEMPKKILKKIARHQLLSSCWGEEAMQQYYKQVIDAGETCMQLSPSFDLDFFEQPTGFGASSGFQTLPANFLPGNNGVAPALSNQQDFNEFVSFLYRQFQNQQQRYKRAIDPPSEEEIREFAEDLADFKDGMKDKIGNVTCILAKMGALDRNLDIDLDFYTRTIWQDYPRADPTLKKKMISGFRDCYSISQSIPQAVLDKKPVLKQFGRHMFYFKCADKMETKLCAQKELARWISEWYGEPDAAFNARIGLPTDEYDAALVTMKVLEHSKSDTEKFVGKFFFGGDM